MSATPRPREATTLLAAAAISTGAVAQGTWEDRAPLPQERTEVSITTDGQRLYLIGGFLEEGDDATAPRELYAYDPGADEWETLGNIPAGVNHAGFVYHEGHLFIVGGYREATFEPIDHLRIYDIDSGEWRDGPPLPTARGALAAVVKDGRIHAIGGKVDEETSVATHEAYDIAAETWDERSEMFTARDHHRAVAIDGEIFVIAGRAGNDYEMTANEIYDPADDTWRRGAEMPTGRSGVGMAAHDGWVYVFGGETFSEPARTFDDAERYDPAADEWEILPPMPTARHGLDAAALDGVIHTVAGGPDPGFAFSDRHEVFVPEASD